MSKSTVKKMAPRLNKKNSKLATTGMAILDSTQNLESL